VEEAPQFGDDRRTEIIRERLGRVGECAEQQPAEAVDAQRPQPVLAHVEARIEPALAADAAAKRDRGQTPRQTVAPLVVDADVVTGITPELAPDQRPAMGAPVDKGPDRAVLVAIDDDRGLADPVRPEIPGSGDLGLEA